ncbi:uncharacterized protein LOC128237921 [Mya arenaria]|uniref:uncharacterized protein LOC128237921 n=1 Tax=Mya arenaria TaxID=6604 RepID=UPI0022E0CC76|nr:uncharacterized protein LOC128237921 [Mya arenaria]
MRTNILMSEVSLPGEPLRMCILPGDRLAVSLRDTGRIQFLKTLEQLSLEENVKVNGECLGISYHKDRLIVSYMSGKVEMMDMTGSVIKTIDKDDSGQSIFGQPFNLIVMSEVQTEVIYVSDGGKSTITKLDMDLNILQTFKDPSLRTPVGITAVGNQLLISGWESNNIMCLDLTSGQMTELLGKVDGINRPLAVFYDHKQKKTYVSFDIKNLVKVYKADMNV